MDTRKNIFPAGVSSLHFCGFFNANQKLFVSPSNTLCFYDRNCWEIAFKPVKFISAWLHTLKHPFRPA